MSNSSSYIVKEGTKVIEGCAFRKRSQLSSVVMKEGLLKIGDAAFSYCKALKRVCIPKTVEEIGVAAFCKSGLEEVVFEGTPKRISESAFLGCERLKRVVVPKGKKSYFEECLGKGRWYEIVEAGLSEKPSAHTEASEEEVDLFGEPNVRQAYLTYNQREFCWGVDDEVKLSELFSGPVMLSGSVSYQFRKKALFVFMKSSMEEKTNKLHSTEYAIPAVSRLFKQKFDEKYGLVFADMVRIFVMVCDDNENARFYDEVRLKKVVENNIIVKSLIRY